MKILDQIPRRLMLLASVLLLSASTMLVAAVQARADSPATPAAPTLAAATPSPTPVGQVVANASAAATVAAPPQPSDPRASQQTAGTPAPQGQPAGTTQSNTTTQTIGQVQSLGCTVGCADTTQTQSADQQNNTVEDLPPASAPPVSSSPSSDPQVSPSSGPAVTPSSSSGAPVTSSQPSDPAVSPSPQSSTTTVTQIQLGCLSHCSGTTTISSDPGRAEEAIDGLLGSSKVPTLPTQNPVAAGQQNVVDQSSLQSQQGDNLTAAQSQGALQTNSTVQSGTPVSFDGISQPTSAQSVQPAPSSQLNSAVLNVLSTVTDLLAIIGSPAGSGSAVSNSAPSDPASVQSDPAASPADSAAWSTEPAASSTAPLTQVVNQTDQAIWQIQIGCLMFCADTDQSQQAAQSDTTTLVTPSPSTSSESGSATVSTDQLIWQLQIGCIFWCYDAVETQTASAISSVVADLLPVISPPPPSGTGTQVISPPLPSGTGGNTSSGPSSGEVAAPSSGPSVSGSPIGPPLSSAPIGLPSPGEIVGDTRPVSAVTTRPALVPMPTAISRRSSVGVASQEAAAISNRQTEISSAVAIGASSLTLGPRAETTASRGVTHPIKHHRVVQALRSRAANEGFAPLRAPQDVLRLVLLALAALVVVLYVGDEARRRYRSPRAPR